MIRKSRVAIQDSNIIYGHSQLKLRLLPKWCTENFLELFVVRVYCLYQHISYHT